MIARQRFKQQALRDKFISHDDTHASKRARQPDSF
jgi:hypothetical protein